MPQSDEGRLTAEVKDQFVGRFEVEGYTVRVNGTFNPPVVPFSVPIAFLEYTSLADLNGTYTFIAPTSFVGQANINIILINANGSLFPLLELLGGSKASKRRTASVCRFFLASEYA
ncbi:hypothetical protein F5887DRAFT_1077806 [Amanita rubescens]|nr:hypothetical protein F5887DRAFT_1077806 [Amanita rubescens]